MFAESIYKAGCFMEDVLKKIRKANNTQIQSLLDAVMDRYRELNPDWEISFFSLLKSNDATYQLDRMIQMLNSIKKEKKDEIK